MTTALRVRSDTGDGRGPYTERTMREYIRRAHRDIETYRLFIERLTRLALRYEKNLARKYNQNFL